MLALKSNRNHCHKVSKLILNSWNNNLIDNRRRIYKIDCLVHVRLVGLSINFVRPDNSSENISSTEIDRTKKDRKRASHELSNPIDGDLIHWDFGAVWLPIEAIIVDLSIKIMIWVLVKETSNRRGHLCRLLFLLLLLPNLISMRKRKIRWKKIVS